MRGKLFLSLLQFLNGHLVVIDVLLALATAPRLFHVFKVSAVLLNSLQPSGGPPPG
jgi:hypothetical protein